MDRAGTLSSYILVNMFSYAFLLLSFVDNVVGRYEMGERVKAMDRLWIETTDRGRRQAGVDAIGQAVMAFFSNRAEVVCKAVDQAIASLEGRKPDAFDALDARVDPVLIEPGEKAQLRITWAYSPASTQSIAIEVHGRKQTVRPGQAVSLEIVPTLAEGKDGDTRVTLTYGDRKKQAKFAVVKNWRVRLSALEDSQSRAAKGMATGIRTSLGSEAETVLPVAEMLKHGESLAQGAKPRDVTELWYGSHGRSVFRAYVPKRADETTHVVIALHGAGGSENLFFEGYGAGIALREAQKRGWIFMSPRTSPSAIGDCLAWLKDVMQVEPKSVFVMGHSAGGGVASNVSIIKPKALALFAPAAGRLGNNLSDTPLFLAIGKQEMAGLRGLGLGLKARAEQNGEFREYDPCEHLMIVADASQDAFRFFDRYAKP